MTPTHLEHLQGELCPFCLKPYPGKTAYKIIGDKTRCNAAGCGLIVHSTADSGPVVYTSTGPAPAPQTSKPNV